MPTTCRHGLSSDLCTYCRPVRTPKVAAPHLPATATLRCLECGAQLAEGDANKTSLVGELMRLRREHSARVHQMSDPYSAGLVELRCGICGAEIGPLDVNATSLGTEMMAYRSDHEREKHLSS